MRTTVEISDRLYRRLRSAAADEGIRGFSPIVEAALSEYLDHASERAARLQAIEAAEGAWTDEEAVKVEQTLRDAWSGWLIRPS